MKRAPLLLLLAMLSMATLALVGCSGDATEGKDVSKEVQDEMSQLGDAARAAGGNYDQLSEADKSKFIQRAGNEETARKMVSTMASSPSGGRSAGQ